jgi:hypothetical protein
MKQLHTGAEHFGNLIFRYSEYHIDASINVNRMKQGSEKQCHKAEQGSVYR